MKIKHIMIISLLLVILTIGTASASDNLTSDNLAINEDLEMQTLSNEAPNEILGNGSEDTFSDLATLIDNTPENGILELDKDYKKDNSTSSDGITITKSMTIDGKGHTLDANGKSRIFKISATDVILKNIVFKNGYSESEGGAV